MILKKTVLATLLLVFTLFLTGCDNQIQQNNMSLQTDALSTDTIDKVEKLEIVDFHGTRRCYSCQTIEKYVHETLKEYFQEELADGTITFQSVNGELAENNAIVTKYQARGSSLFINAIQDGKETIEEDTMVWRLVGDEQKFKSYFKEKIETLLG